MCHRWGPLPLLRHPISRRQGCAGQDDGSRSPYSVSVVSLWPGLTKTEAVLAEPDRYVGGAAATPQFSGRAMAALIADPAVLTKTGRVLKLIDLAPEYGSRSSGAAHDSPRAPNLRGLRSTRPVVTPRMLRIAVWRWRDSVSIGLTR
jgi:hypothetical protein